MNYDENGRDKDREEGTMDDHLRGIRVQLGLRPLTDLLGTVLELTVSEPPTSETIATRMERTDNHREQPRVNGGKRATTRDRESVPEECRIDTRLSDTTFTVVADLPGATIGGISVGINQRTNELVISREGTVVGRVGIPWESPEATRVWFNNGILEVRLEPQKA